MMKFENHGYCQHLMLMDQMHLTKEGTNRKLQLVQTKMAWEKPLSIETNKETAGAILENSESIVYLLHGWNCGPLA